MRIYVLLCCWLVMVQSHGFRLVPPPPKKYLSCLILNAGGKNSFVGYKFLIIPLRAGFHTHSPLSYERPGRII